MDNQIKTKDDFLATACAEINTVDIAQAEVLIAQQALVLDVREAEEFQLGHLLGAVNIPRGLLEFKVNNHPSLTDCQRSILLYCKNGGRSTLAAYTLKQMGFTQVKMLAGGFDGWSAGTQAAENSIL